MAQEPLQDGSVYPNVGGQKEGSVSLGVKSLSEDSLKTFSKSQANIRDIPWYVWFVVFNELCERFAYYGISGILFQYLNEQLGYSDSASTSITLAWAGLAYLAPLLGGYLADQYFGKFKIIVSFSGIYAIGAALLSLSAVHDTAWLAFISLILIAIGTGGIKPCVSSFGADQIPEGPQKAALTSSFFRLFYAAINIGSIGSFVVTPILADQAGYAWAFGVPAMLMVIAIGVVWWPNKHYYHAPKAGSMISMLIQIVITAYRNRYDSDAAADIELGTDVGTRSESTESSHWLDKAIPEFGEQNVKDTKAVWRILPVFCALPVFWMLFQQQNNAWLDQAKALDRSIGGTAILPAQTQLMNPIFILILLPLFDRVIFPGMDALGIGLRDLGRMVVGMLLAAAAFFATSTVQWYLDHDASPPVIWWQVIQFFLISTGEILVSTQGLDFSYHQAPKTMKSVISALNLLTVSIGSLLASAVYGGLSKVLSTFWLFILFACLMLVNTAIFMIIRQNYVYVDYMNDHKKEKSRKASSAQTLEAPNWDENSVEEGEKEGEIKQRNTIGGETDAES